MCATCGCGSHVPDHEHGHSHGHELDPGHMHPHVEPRLVALERDVLGRNDEAAGRVRAELACREVLSLNFLSSPGSGKTTLLERTIRALSRKVAIRVIEGDQETSRDAERIRAAGAEALQINTGTACHLDAATIERAVASLAPPERSFLFIENVGNLVCPALFDLGESARVVVASVAEGDDKPLKYPHMFRACDLIVLNKVDLLPHVPFDVAQFEHHLRHLNPRAPLLRL
jgi:hydrogenase nickel incorporation protein HypB